MADHPLKSAIDRSLGGAVTSPTSYSSAGSSEGDKSFSLQTHPVLATVSRSYSEPLGRFPHVTHPCATRSEDLVRLACMRHAASVRSEP